MRYRILLKTLKVLIYAKRFFWWLGAKSLFILAKFFAPGWRFFGFIHYKLNYLFRRLTGTAGFSGQLVKRDNLQVVVFISLFLIALPQTKLYAKHDTRLPGQSTIAYSLTPTDEDYSVEEVTADVGVEFESASVPFWKAGVLSPDQFTRGSLSEMDLGSVVAGGMALSKPIIFPGSSVGGSRDQVVEYVVQAGDSLGSIAAKFLVDINTILWENNLGIRSYLHPGDKLRILPMSGLAHLIKKGDTLKKIAATYDAKVDDIIKVNKLKADGTDLVIGERIIVPNGVKPQSRVVVAPRVGQIAAPPASRQAPSVSGFVWPTAVRVLTQYFTWKHHGLDIAGGTLSTPNYASKAGVVEKSQCGWNSGYGCVIIIDHGGGIKTLYGHNSRLLVSPGEYVSAGQTIGLMGNTGNVRGRTGIHLHFEVWVNGVRTNPFRFVK